MSITTRAYGGIGVLLWTNDIKWPSTSTPSCDHPERVDNTFCPACGKKVEIIVEEQGTRDCFVEAFQKTNPNKKLFIAETVYYDWNRGDAHRNNGIFIGYGGEAGGYGRQCFASYPIPTTDLKSEIATWEKAAFAYLVAQGIEPPPSIADTNFGLHLINYVS
jgi:hypothetical protein